MIKISIILFSVISEISMGQDNIVTWSKDYFLDWSDFQADANPSTFEDAHSTIKYRCTWTVNSDVTDNQIRFFIENIRLIVEFHPLLSWVRFFQVKSDLLKHEQGHFDLAELLRPEIMEQIRNVFYGKKFLTLGRTQEQQKQFARENSTLMITNEIEKWEEYLFEKRKDYDTQTNFGQIVEKQQEYDNKFREMRNNHQA
jgi:hypothetical protein